MEKYQRTPPEVYQQVIKANREIMTDLELGVFLGLHDGVTRPEIARRYGLSLPEIGKIVWRYMPRKHHEDKPDRLTKTGRPYKKRLSRAALMAIVLQNEELTDEERHMLKVMAESQNQGIAARALGKTWKDLESEYRRIRRTHDF